MATADETGTAELPAFSTLKPFQQSAVVMRAEGQTVEVITNQINADFGLAYKASTVREWFYVTGKLYQALLEYNEKMADEAIKAGRRKLKRLSERAADTLSDLLGDHNEGSVRHNAAKTILAKFIPDRQVVVDGGKESELPDELKDRGDEVMNGGDDAGNADTKPTASDEAAAAGTDPVDDARQSAPNN